MMSQTCDLTHGLPHEVFWRHSPTICQFIEKLSQQRKNFESFSNVIIHNKTIKPQLAVSIFGNYSKIFDNKHFIHHIDIMKLVDQAIKKIKIRNGPKKNWNIQEIVILIWVVNQFEYFFQIQFYKLVRQKIIQNTENWEQIALYVPGKNKQQCLFKMLKFHKKKLHQFPWTKQEGVLLKQLVDKATNRDWNKISEQLYFLSKNPSIYRLPKQCRQHWASYIAHDFKKGPWNINEDIILLQTVLKVGKSWTKISKTLSGRTQNAIKNRCSLLMTKCQYYSQQSNSNKNIEILLQKMKQQTSSKLPHDQSQNMNISEQQIEQDFYISQQSQEHDIYFQRKIQTHLKNQTNTNFQLQNNSQSNSFQNLDIGRFLSVQQFHINTFSEFSISQSR